MRKLAVAVVAVCAMSAGTISTASAHKVTYKTRTHMFYSPPTPEFPTYDLIGSIRSKNPACETRRKVALLYNGNRVGSTTSFAFQDLALYGFTRKTPPPSGTYKARVRPKVLTRNARHTHRCAGVISNAVQIQ